MIEDLPGPFRARLRQLGQKADEFDLAAHRAAVLLVDHFKSVGNLDAAFDKATTEAARDLPPGSTPETMYETEAFDKLAAIARTRNLLGYSRYIATRYWADPLGMRYAKYPPDPSPEPEK